MRRGYSQEAQTGQQCSQKWPMRPMGMCMRLALSPQITQACELFGVR
jgi:hypothetical protein